jgi:ADP-ribose pyrophosphatase YjhB (NUDIX family)
MKVQQQILPAVAAIIFNDEGNVLLQYRKDVGKWGIISGHVEFGETITEALLREIKEETNTAAEIVRFIGIYSSPDWQTYRYAEKTIHYITAYFEARFTEEVDLDYHDHETAALQFFSPHRLPQEMAQINPFWLTDALNVPEAPFMR